jgi:hypothetical protein
MISAMIRGRAEACMMVELHLLCRGGWGLRGDWQLRRWDMPVVVVVDDEIV